MDSPGYILNEINKGIKMGMDSISNVSEKLQDDDLKKDLIAVISKYMEFDEKNLEVQVEDKEDMAILEVNIPISQLKRSY